MSDAVVQLAPDGSGKAIDAEQLTVGASEVHRQRIQITGAADVEVARVTSGVPGASDQGLVVRPVAAMTAGGCTPFKRISTADTNGANVKASAGQVYAILVSSINAAVRYLKLYDKATAPTVGTDVPVLTFPIPGAVTGVVVPITIPPGTVFASGIGIGLTTGVADADTGAVAAGEHVVNLWYK